MNKLSTLISRLDQIQKYEVPSEGIYTFLNPFSYLIYRRNTALFCAFNRVFIDGMLLVLLLRISGYKVVRRSFDMTSLAPMVFRDCIEKEKSIFFLGAKPEEIKNFVSVIKKKYPKLKILGFRDGYFENDDDQMKATEHLRNLNPNVLVVGMGTPLQEKVLAALKEKGWNGVGYTCGGFFHQTAKKIQYYPKWIDYFNLRWLFRIWDEPNLIKRYLLYYPVSVALFTVDILSFKLKRS